MRNRIVSFVSPHSKILDLGCGNGELLTTLKKDKQCYCYGVDINYDNIVACTARGISVFQGDLDDGLSGFSEQSYDVVILSQTLQQVRRPLFVIEEMLRVGKMAVVTFPNFAHWKHVFSCFSVKFLKQKRSPIIGMIRLIFVLSLFPPFGTYVMKKELILLRKIM